jgi:hypothetical protein
MFKCQIFKPAFLVSILLGTLMATSAVFAEVTATVFTPYDGTNTWQNFRLLPQAEHWEPMYQNAEDIAADLNADGGRYALDYKTKGGSSHQTVVRRVADGQILGIWSAPNHATYLLGEIFTFNISRLFNRSQWSTPAVRMTLTGPGRVQALNANQPDVKARACNREHILNYMQANPYYIVGMFKPFATDAKPVDLPEIVDTKAMIRLQTEHFLVRSLSKDNPQPADRNVFLTEQSTLTFDEANTIAFSNEKELAKQLSFMMLMDALSSQRDRFGPFGTNMQAMLNTSKETFTLSLIDNGGTMDGAFSASMKYFLGNAGGPAVTRFEREIFDRVLVLDDFVKGKRAEFLGFKTIEELKIALGYETNPDAWGPVPAPGPACKYSHVFLFAPLKERWDIKWTFFLKSLDMVAAHMRPLENEPNAFF